MAINFPDSPTNGQVFTSGTSSWTYDGVKWSLNSNTTTTNDSMPVGSILWYSTTTTPTGWLPADGAAVSRTTYATLFSLISTTYGVGDGSTTFNVPSVSATTGKYFVRYTTSVGTVTTTSLATSPVGTMLDWPVTSSYPTGFLRADGSAVSRTSYADLFALIGTTYGVGDGSTTFNLPNLIAAGSGSPVSIIKASLGGTVEPSTVAHAASHIRSGSDVIDGDRSQIDFVPSRYARDSSPTEAGATTDLTAHLKGIDTSLNSIWVPPMVRCAQSTATTLTSGTETVITFNGTDEYDTYGQHDPATNNSRVTIPITGVYMLQGCVHFLNGTTQAAPYFRKNGTTGLGSGPNMAATTYSSSMAVTAYLTTSDYVEFLTYCGNANSTYTPGTWMAVTFIGKIS